MKDLVPKCIWSSFSLPLLTGRDREFQMSPLFFAKWAHIGDHLAKGWAHPEEITQYTTLSAAGARSGSSSIPLRKANMAAAAAIGTLTFSASLRSIPIPPPIPHQNPHKPPPPKRISAKFDRSLEEIYNVRVERGVSSDRLEELGVGRWSTWRTGTCRLPWDWHVDQQVYVVSGEVRLVPEGAKCGDRFMRFVAGDLVRYPKWLEADLFFNGPYEEKYRFLAYGDD